MGEQQLILTAALAGVATAYLDNAAPAYRPAPLRTVVQNCREAPTTAGDADPQEVWRRILFRSTEAA